MRQQALSGSPLDPNMPLNTGNPNPGIFTGHAPNPNLQVHRRGPNQNKRPRESSSLMAPVHIPSPSAQGPSLTMHLLNTNQSAFIGATEQPFLSHAGCGTLSAPALSQWMIQDTHYQRAYIRFVGNLLGKIRLPSAPNSQFHPLYRTMDMLISALNNLRREMSFFENTATKYGIHLADEKPMPITRAYIDLFISVSEASSSLLEGMVVLWATEHVRNQPFFSIHHPPPPHHHLHTSRSVCGSSANIAPSTVLPHSLALRILLHPLRPYSLHRIPHRLPPPSTHT